jgi:hypothetical protein
METNHRGGKKKDRGKGIKEVGRKKVTGRNSSRQQPGAVSAQTFIIQIKMRTYAIIILTLFLSSCALKVNQSDAKKVAESLLTDIMNNNYDNINNYYSDLSNDSQPKEQKILRFKQLQEVTGTIKSFEFMDAKEEYDSDKGLNQLTLHYKVHCEKVTVMQTFLFINDEGHSKIIFQNIENLKS